MFDRIIVTAANAAQARGYRAQVRAHVGVLARAIDVVSDPGGRRVGSLGATVNVLRRLPDAALRDARILICHSGGDARRTPAYAALGKAFVPMPDGRPLFAHIAALMDRLPPKAGVTVCCGDVLPRLDVARVSFAEAGVTGVAYPDGPDRARRHGVYVSASSGKSGRVVGFMQKPAVTTGRFLIDTGILHIDTPTAARMRALPVAGDIYAEFPRLLLSGFAPFHVAVVPACEFFHIGSSRELLGLLGRDGLLADACAAPLGTLGGDNIVTHVPAGHPAVNLKRGECLTCLPVGANGWYELRYTLDDNFKEDGKWERLGLGERMKKVNHARLLKLRADAAPVIVEKPLRLDLAGGWSDTPPICCEMGGRVLNAAVLLDGVKPVRVAVRRIPEPEVRVKSADLGKEGVLRTLGEIRAPKDPHDWCALVKSALTVVKFDFRNGGLDICISAAVPKGSGLGTSSILGAALVEALQKIRGRAHDWQTVATLTLALEQEMQTGGGWEDQVGALVPGVKVFDTKPGRRQVFRVRRLTDEAEEAFAKFLDERALLYFTGRKRMARNVLRGVLNFYRQNPEDIAHEIIRRLKEDAENAYQALVHGDWEAFCTALNAYWHFKKALDPGSTNALVESIIARMAPWISAVCLCGAGGGGFMFAIARSRAAKAKMRAVLEKYPPIREGRFFDCRLDR